MDKEKEKILSIFKEAGILSPNNKRKFCWKSKFNSDCQEIFENFKSKGKYRSDDEAWFCLCHDIEPQVCQVCGQRLAVFHGLTKYGQNGYKSVCEFCEPNQAPKKLQKFHKTIELRNKGKKVNQPKYIGRGSNYKSEDFKEHSKRIKLEKYGDENFNNRKKCEDTMLKKYGVRFVGQSKEAQLKSQLKKKETVRKIEEENNCTMISTLVKRYGQGFKKLNIPKLKIKSHIFIENKYIEEIEKYSKEGSHTNAYTSKPEKEVVEYIKSIYSGSISENDTSVVPNLNHRTFELDIYLPELKLAFDFNGSYWHSTKYKDKYYHQRKVECCRKAGIQIFNIYEDIWNNDKDEIKLKIKECIKSIFKNVIRKEEDVIIGSNDYPIFGDIEIVRIDEPEFHQAGSFGYYDAGKIFYKERC